MNAPLSLPRTALGAACAHCGQPIPEGRDDAYCCRGCRAVASLLVASGLDRYYDLRNGPGTPVSDLPDRMRPRAWLEPIAEQLRNAPIPERINLDLQGIHCTACVWLVETLFDQRAHGGAIEINPALGRAELCVGREFPLTEFVDAIESFGYRVGPDTTTHDARASDELLVRAGITLALAGNGMMLSAAVHLGLHEGIAYRWASHLAYGCAVIAMLVGMPVFARSAIEGVKRRVLHLDLPIALGMGLAFAGSTWSFLTRSGANYVDTLTTFVALMLLGRWLQNRVLERNRRELLRDDGVEGIVCRREVDRRVELTPCVRIAPGDVLVITPGDLVPTAAELLDRGAAFSFDWIDGESRPHELRASDVVPSGAILAGDTAVRVRATETFSTSRVASLLRAPRANDREERRLAGLPKNLGGAYVAFVLVAAVVTFVVSFATSHALVHALEATTAALVVTCPCAFGIAVPLGYEVVQSALRRVGVFVREPSAFDRALHVDEVLFDKTGTLTTGMLALDPASRDALSTLEPHALAVLEAIAARSNHPKARAVADATSRLPFERLGSPIEVRESRGLGLEATVDGRVHRLGSRAFVGRVDDAGAADADLVYAIDGRVVLALTTTEEIRPEARRELEKLRALGCRVSMLSGDREARCREIGGALGLESSHIHGEASPEDKERFVRALGRDRVMMIGDGLNDARALAAAALAGTPSIERPFTASRCDFFFVSPGLDAVTRVLAASRSLSRVVRADLAIALVYNAVAVALSIAGLMQPWLAAILMPASSLGTIAFTVLSLRGDENRWKS